MRRRSARSAAGSSGGPSGGTSRWRFGSRSRSHFGWWSDDKEPRMFSATVTATLVVVFRETLEAGLIVGIILTVLHRLGAMRYTGRGWGGAGLAIGASLLAG